jgi:hypothetical protein
MIAALRRQLGTGQQEFYSAPRFERNCGNRETPKIDNEYETQSVACPGGGRIDYIRNDRLSLISEFEECGHQCFPWHREISEYAFLVLNTGQHIRPIEEFDFEMRRTADFLRNNYNGKVIYRLSSAGHPNCMTYTKPISRTEDAAFRSSFKPLPYNWHFLDGPYNAIATAHFGALPGAVIMDTDGMTRLRPDSHRSHDDCLHHAIPGVPDFWNLMLYHIVVGNLV